MDDLETIAARVNMAANDVDLAIDWLDGYGVPDAVMGLLADSGATCRDVAEGLRGTIEGGCRREAALDLAGRLDGVADVLDAALGNLAALEVHYTVVETVSDAVEACLGAAHGLRLMAGEG